MMSLLLPEKDFRLCHVECGPGAENFPPKALGLQVWWDITALGQFTLCQLIIAAVFSNTNL